MKRKFTIKANGGDVTATISVEVKSRSGKLARHELEWTVEELADAIMKPIPSVRYLRTPISRIRVSGV